MSRLPLKEINIIGYSLRLPESDNPHEFHQNLINKVNMVTKDERRWRPGYQDTPEYFGKLKQSIDYFDHVFFAMSGKQAEKLDPQIRLLLETSFEALMSAALFPADIKGSATGVYVGGCFSDAHRFWLKDSQFITGYEHSGCAGTMVANRLSYFYDIHGPSLQIDTACASSLTALYYAIQDLKQGKCDTAFVCGGSILLDSAMTVAFNKLHMLSLDGFCKTFDKSANGYTRSEGMVTLLLTTRSDLIFYEPYAKILASSINTCGYHEHGISFPSHQWQAELYQQVTQQSKTAPKDIRHIECHGTGTVAGDEEEVLGIKHYFGDRADLSLGALKTNMGHAEGASGLASVAKVLLGYETRTLYPQLHLQDRMPTLGNLRTITEPELWSGGKTLVNSFGFGGANASVLLEQSSRLSLGPTKTCWHDLYFISSRTKEGLYQLKRELEKAPQQIPVFNDQKYPWREVVGLADDVQLEPIEPRPLYFVFSGNGSQWRGMGLHLLKTSPLFKKVLRECGRDIPALLINGWEGPLQDTRLLTAIQIGLIELLKSFGVTADGYVAHSAGEIAASYASGATTLRQTMAIAKARGKAAEKMPDGLMISVGLSAKDISPYIAYADSVNIACINSPRNITLSGDRQQLMTIMQQLQSEKIFVRELNTHGKPYHSSLIDRKKVKAHLKRTVKGQVKRHTSWISAIHDYNPEHFCVDYHLESVTRPVDFLDAMNKIPANAIALEIGPHSVLRSLVRDCAPNIKYVSLMSKDSNDLEAFKQGIGRLWTLGAAMQITPHRERVPLAIRAKQVAWKRDYFPVPRDSYKEKKYKHTFVFELQGKDEYLMGHRIDGKPIFPAMGYVYIFWQCYLKEQTEETVVTLDHFKIFRSIPLIGEQLKLNVLLSASGTYQLVFNEELIAEAILGQKSSSPSKEKGAQTVDENLAPLNKETFYRQCHNEGYTYEAPFQVISEITPSHDLSHIYATLHFEEWISFLDGLLQMSLMVKPTPGLRLPTAIRHIELAGEPSDSAVYSSYVNSIQCGDVLIEGLETTLVARKKEEETIVFQKESYLLLGQNDAEHETQFIEKCISVVRANANMRINLFVVGEDSDESLNAVEPYLYHSDVIEHQQQLELSLIEKSDLIIYTSTLDQAPSYLQQLYEAMKPGAFLLLLGDKQQSHFKCITFLTDANQNTTAQLLRKRLPETYELISAPTISYDESWANHIKNSNGPFVMVAEVPGGMAGFARSLSREGKKTLSYCGPQTESFLDEVKACGLVTNIVTNGRLATLCYTTTSTDLSAPAIEAYHLEFNEPGQLDAFQFVKNKPRKGQQCQVAFAALNFRDVMFASGKINKETFLGFSKDSSGIGMEFSGHIDGKRIMGIGLDAVANAVQTDFYWEIPAEIDLASAATIPVAYLTVYYAFFERAQLMSHHKVLIHGGSGAVGQAAIHVALAAGCEVFTTCHDSKRDYLKTKFPQLDDAHIGDSRSVQFERQLLEITQSKGVDIILNSLADDKLQASLRCLAQHGVFIEIGKYDLMRNTPIGMRHLLANTTICGVDVDQIFADEAVMARLSTRLLNGLKQGIVKPLDVTIFNPSQITEAFRFLGSGKHLGKVLLNMQEEHPRAVNRFYTTGAHLIVGGLGGFGMALAEWLAARGAEQLILLSRKGATTGEQQLFLQRLKIKYPLLHIDLSTADLIHPESAQAFIKSCPPLTGIYNLSLALNDTYFDGMDREKWEDTINCKVRITQHLDQYTHAHPLKHFVCFSSLAVHGNPGQSNYAFANHFMETICYKRRQAGLPAMAIQWGAVGKVGYVSKQDSSLIEILSETLGTSIQSIDSCLTYFERCMLSSNTVNLVYRAYVKQDKHQSSAKVDVLTRISQLLKMDFTSIPDQTNLTALGMDSLQAAEIQSLISHALQEVVPIPKLAKMTIAELKSMLSPQVSSTIIEVSPEPQQMTMSAIANEEESPRSEKTSKNTKILRKLTHLPCKWLFKTRCPIAYQGLEHLPKNAPFLLCANQSSHLDILTLIYASNRSVDDFVAFTAQDHLNHGWINRLKKLCLPLVVDFFPIDRHAGSTLNLENTIANLKSHVDSNKILAIFPEGTRTKTGKIQEFKLGASYLAHQLNLPVVPAYIHGTYHCLPYGKSVPKKGAINVTFGKPLVFSESEDDLSQYSTYQEFTEKLYQEVVRLGLRFETTPR